MKCISNRALPLSSSLVRRTQRSVSISGAAHPLPKDVGKNISQTLLRINGIVNAVLFRKLEGYQVTVIYKRCFIGE